MRKTAPVKLNNFLCPSFDLHNHNFRLSCGGLSWSLFYPLSHFQPGSQPTQYCFSIHPPADPTKEPGGGPESTTENEQEKEPKDEPRPDGMNTFKDK